jgi:ankyrin repeat protein
LENSPGCRNSTVNGPPACRAGGGASPCPVIRALILFLLILTAHAASADETLHAAAAAGDLAEIERLRDAGANPNARDTLGRTPLHAAALAGQREAAMTLIRRGADPQAYDDQHLDALTVAAERGDHAMVALLLWLGADPGAVTGPEDRTALIAAARGHHADVVRELAAAGAPVNWVSSLGWTALMEAVIFGDGSARTVETVQALLDVGAKPRFRDWQGTTSLRLAQMLGYDAVADLLIAAGAD